MFGEQQRFMLLLIAPAALLMMLFQVVPIAIGANASFRDWALYNPKKTWVGFTSRTARAGLPCIDRRLHSSSSVNSRAVPFTRKECG